MISTNTMVVRCKAGHIFEISQGALTNFVCPVCGTTLLTVSQKVITKIIDNPPENKAVEEAQVEKKDEPQGMTTKLLVPKKGGRLRF